MIIPAEKSSKSKPVVWRGLLLHNVAEIQDTADGLTLLRVPERVRRCLNSRAQPRAFESWGMELQYVADEGPLTLEISSIGESRISVFHGDFQAPQTWVIGRERTSLTLSRHERMDLTVGMTTEWTYPPSVTRIALQGDPVRLHGTESAAHRPPHEDELPAGRLIAYGTSITCGVGASFPHLGYAKIVADVWRASLINLGTRGSAYCDLAMAKYMEARDDWDAALLEISVNMLNTCSPREFETKAEKFLDCLLAKRKPLICISVLPHFRDLGSSPTSASHYRDALFRVVDKRKGDFPVTFVDGTNLMTLIGLSADLLHPSDRGHAEIAANILRLVPKPSSFL